MSAPLFPDGAGAVQTEKKGLVECTLSRDGRAGGEKRFFLQYVSYGISCRFHALPAEKRLGPAVNVIALNAMHYKLNTATGKERLLISFFLD